MSYPKIAKLHLFFAMSPVLTGGCAIFQPEPVIENRFAKVWPQPGTTDLIDLSVSSSAPSSGGRSVKLTELGDRAQAALVFETNGKPPTELTTKEESAAEVGSIINATVDRKVEFALRPSKFLSPGDRVDAIRISMVIQPAQADLWKITGWKQARNADTIIEIGKLTDTSSNTLSASTGLNVAKFLPDASISAEAGRERAREVQIRDVGELNAAVDQSGEAWIDETAGWRMNLARSRNSIDVTITASPNALKQQSMAVATKLWDDAVGGALPQPVVPSKFELRTIVRFVPRADTRPICGVATLSYRLRHIVNFEAQATFSESDDEVQFQIGEPANVTFQLAPSPHRPLYMLEAAGSKLRFRDAAGVVTDLKFATMDQALAFRTWLIRALPAGGAIANGTIGMQHLAGGIAAITAADLRALMAGPADPAALVAAQKADLIGCNSWVSPG